VQRILDVILRREQDDPHIPNCPVHGVEMRLRGKQGRPTRFSQQTEQEYSLIFFCPVSECDETKIINRVKTQIPVPGEAPDRPGFARRD
jgi:hypothetical protein